MTTSATSPFLLNCFQNAYGKYLTHLTQFSPRTFIFHILGTFPWYPQWIFCLRKDEATVVFSSTHQTVTLSLKTTVSLRLNRS